MVIVRHRNELRRALATLYNRLANFSVRNLDFDKASVILEAGCGSGQLTFPLVNKITKIKKRFTYIAFDISSGPYERELEKLKEEAHRKGLEKTIKAIKGDVRCMREIANESVDLIISNELLCDLDPNGLESAIKEFYRILKPHGSMMHSVLSPTPKNEAQKLFIIADSYAVESLQPKPPWFSPTSEHVEALLKKLNLSDVKTEGFETNLKLSHDAALELIKQWNVNQAFILEHGDELRKYGMEFPETYVVFCKKP